MGRRQRTDLELNNRPSRGEFPFRIPFQHLVTAAVASTIGGGIAYTVAQNVPLTIAFAGIAVLAIALGLIGIQAETRAANPAPPRARTCGTCGEPVEASPDQIIVRGDAYCDDRCAFFAW